MRRVGEFLEVTDTAMNELILKSRTSRLANLGYLALAAVLALALLIAGIRQNIAAIIALTLFGAAVYLSWLSLQKRTKVLIDQHGLTIQASYAAVQSIPWHEIEAFGIASLGSISGGVYSFTGKQYVGIRLSNSSNLKISKQCTDNRLLSDYDVLLSAIYGMPLKEFEAFLVDAKKRAEGG